VPSILDATRGPWHGKAQTKHDVDLQHSNTTKNKKMGGKKQKAMMGEHMLPVGDGIPITSVRSTDTSYQLLTR
jgi:hypothetical protein